MPAHPSVWVGTLAKVLEKFGNRQPSEERALWKANAFPLPREQEFFKACNYRAAEQEAARGSHAAGTAARAGALAGSEACAIRAAWMPPGCPRDTQTPSG